MFTGFPIVSVSERGFGEELSNSHSPIQTLHRYPFIKLVHLSSTPLFTTHNNLFISSGSVCQRCVQTQCDPKDDSVTHKQQSQGMHVCREDRRDWPRTCAQGICAGKGLPRRLAKKWQAETLDPDNKHEREARRCSGQCLCPRGDSHDKLETELLTLSQQQHSKNTGEKCLT